MEEYQVELTALAEDTIAAIGHYYLTEVQDAELALVQTDSIYEAIVTLSSLPHRFQAWQNPPGSIPNLRQFQQNNYVILYTIDDSTKTVFVLAVFHHSRDIQNLIKTFLS